MTATLLFIDGHPVPYIIEPDGDAFALHPAHDSHPEVVAPHLKAWHNGNHWIVEGCPWQDLYDQVIEDLENYLQHNTAHKAVS